MTVPFCGSHHWNDHLWSGKPAGKCQLKTYLSKSKEDRRKYLTAREPDNLNKVSYMPHCAHNADHPNELCESCSLLLERCERCGKRLLPGQPRNPSQPPAQEESSSE